MTKIDFYVLKTADSANRQVFACRLAEKAYQQGHHVYIHTGSPEESQQINETLWSFRADSFVPHELHQHADHEDCPVLIGHDSNPPRLMDVLINLNPQQPLFFSQFERLAEIVDDNNDIKQSGRQRYQFYKQRGYQLDTHHIDK